MPYATYDYTTLDQMLAQAKVELRLDYTNSEDFYILRFLLKCSEEMMTKTEFIEKPEILPIDCGIAILPCDFVKFDRPYPLRFTCNGLPDNAYSWLTVTYTGGPMFNCLPCNSGVPVINIQDGKIQFSTHITATECEISYLGLNIDADGKLKIPRINSRPIIAGACYMYLRALEKPSTLWSDYKQEWILCKANRRGMANMLNSFERQQMYRTMNAVSNYQGVNWW